MNEWTDQKTIEKILRTYQTWAVVGCSNDPRRPSHTVALFLKKVGYNVICVNPNHDACIPGLPCYPDLSSIEEPVDVVDIFRRPQFAGLHVDEAIEIGAKAVWMQLGVIDEEAARRAAEAGLDVIMDRCPRIEFRPEYRAA
jgi:predicted CoA-binding protein